MGIWLSRWIGKNMVFLKRIGIYEDETQETFRGLILGR
jgi:hypothetical protein